MDAITHTILAIASIAGAWYGGRWLLVREARSMFPRIASPELKREMQLMDAIIKQMAREDDAYVERTEARESEPLQLELFPDWGRNGQEKA